MTEYVKVTDSIFDLRDAFEAGELYFLWSENYSKVNDEEELLYSYKVKRLYRKIEKPADWKEVARECGFTCELNQVGLCPISEDDFIKFIKRIYPLIK